MSHFALAVFTNDADPDDTVERALAPYHEFECTGLDNEFVQNIDITERSRAEYNNPERTRSMLRLADGTLISAWDNSLWRELTDVEEADLKSKGFFNDRELSDGRRVTRDNWGTDVYHARTPNYPEGSEEVEISVAECMTFAEFVDYWHSYKVLGSVPADETKYGWIELDENGDIARIIDRTNPNAQWDWWVIGGRYSERLFVKDGAGGDRGKRSWGMEDKPDTGGLDTALLVDINWDRMKADKIAERRRWFRQEYPKYLVELAKAGQDEDEIKKVNGSANFMWGWNAETMKTEDDYVGTVKPLTAFAAIYNGTWNESGKMGWFGMVSDEKDAGAWETEFQAILDDAMKTPTMRLTIVDCHI